MESGPLSSQEFKDFADDVVLFCHITSRVPGRKHDGLLSEKGGRGFPYLVYMDAEGNVIGKPAGRSVEAFRAGAEKAAAYCALAAKDDRTPAEELELLTLQIEFGAVTADEARKRAESMGELDDEAKAKLDEAMAMLEAKEFDKQVAETLQSKGNARDPQKRKQIIKEVGELFFGWYSEGKRTSGDPMAAQNFYGVMLSYGLEHKNAEVARTGYEGLNETFGDQPGARAKLDQILKQVEALEGGE